MQSISISDTPHQIFTVLLDGGRAELDVQYNDIWCRWYVRLSVDDVCIGSFKIVNNSLLVRDCSPDDFGDFIAVGTDLTREAFNDGNLTLYYVTPAEAEILEANGY